MEKALPGKYFNSSFEDAMIFVILIFGNDSSPPGTFSPSIMNIVNECSFINSRKAGDCQAELFGCRDFRKIELSIQANIVYLALLFKNVS
jgi:hypothetical protein